MDTICIEGKTHHESIMMGFLLHLSSASARCERRMAFTFFIRFFTDGLVKNVRFLNSFNTPDRSYFFLNVLKHGRSVHFH